MFISAQPWNGVCSKVFKYISVYIKMLEKSSHYYNMCLTVLVSSKDTDFECGLRKFRYLLLIPKGSATP